MLIVSAIPSHEKNRTIPVVTHHSLPVHAPLVRAFNLPGPLTHLQTQERIGTRYFSPTLLPPGAASYRGGPDEDLAAAIDQARLSVDAAIYDLNLWSIRDALIAAHRRGVERAPGHRKR